MLMYPCWAHWKWMLQVTSQIVSIGHCPADVVLMYFIDLDMIPEKVCRLQAVYNRLC